MKAEKQEGGGHGRAHPQKTSTVKPSFLAFVFSGKSEQTPLGSQAILVWQSWGVGHGGEGVRRRSGGIDLSSSLNRKDTVEGGEGGETKRGTGPSANSDSILVPQRVPPCLFCLICAGLHLCLIVYLPLPKPFLSIFPAEIDAIGGPFCLRQRPWSLPSQPDYSLLIWEEEATGEGILK